MDSNIAGPHVSEGCYGCFIFQYCKSCLCSATDNDVPSVGQGAECTVQLSFGLLFACRALVHVDRSGWRYCESPSVESNTVLYCNNRMLKILII